MDHSLSGSSIHGIFQARVLEWMAISFSRGSSRPRNRTWVSCIAGRCFTVWATRKACPVALSHKLLLRGPLIWALKDGVAASQAKKELILWARNAKVSIAVVQRKRGSKRSLARQSGTGGKRQFCSRHTACEDGQASVQPSGRKMDIWAWCRRGAV